MADLFVPPARKEIASPSLKRPDWTKPDPRDPQLLWLDKNENTDPEMLAVVDRAFSRMSPRAVTSYPDAGPLYVALAELLGVGADSLVLASGSDGIIGAVSRAFLERGDRVILPKPTYAMYEVYCAMHGADVTRVEYGVRDGRPWLDPDAVLAAIERVRPKLVCLPNADSPTGMITEPAALRRIVAAALAAGALVLVDEAYFPFYPVTVAGWIADFPNLIVARTFSKAWALTGLRLGFAITAPANAALLQKVRPNYEVNGVGATLACTMVQHHEAEMLASVQRLNDGRDAFMRSMRELGLATINTHASFCHVAFGERAAEVHKALSTVVLYRADFHDPCLRGYSRFSATTTERFQPVIAAVRRALGAAR